MVVKTLEQEFHTSSNYPVPSDWHGSKFQIRNDYPKEAQGLTYNHTDFPMLPLPEIEVTSPWFKDDFKTNPLDYAATVLEYCWEGNVNNEFVVQNNKDRDWFHAPWMHASTNGREPLKGLTFERPIPPLEFAKTQKKALQNWAIGFYNAPGALTFGQAWADPSNPTWTNDLHFHPGTCVFKLLFTTATEDQIPSMKGAPEFPAVISPQPVPTKAPTSGELRDNFTSRVRLIQVDWATVDHRSPIGWVFGTFMYNGFIENESDPWRRLTPVGVMWGNDPQLNEAAFKRGEKPKESWINPVAEQLRVDLGGRRPSWGYNGRLNGPADNFVSACVSCHSTAQSYTAPMVQPGTFDSETKTWTPMNERLTMTWFENVKAGETFSVRGALSADYSLQFMIGWNNYLNWKKTNQANKQEPDPNKKILLALPGRRVVFRYSEGLTPEDRKAEKEVVSRINIEHEPLRAGPDFDWT